MADAPRDPRTPDDAGAGPEGESPPGVPRWVKVSGIIALVLALLVAVMLLMGGHGPGRHMSGDRVGRTTFAVAEHGTLRR